MNVPHVFLTRFNLPSTKVENSIYSQTWLRERYQLFCRFTVPSVRAQTAESCHWIIYLNPNSPDWLKQAMDELERSGVATPNYGGKVAHDHVSAHLRALLGRDKGQVITSNLDNDDGLAIDFVQRLRQVPVSQPTTALYLTNGLIRSGGRLYRRADPENAFGAVRSDLSQLQTCWSQWHNRLHTVMPVNCAGGAPGWLQVVHGTNVSNRVRGRLVDPQSYRDAFPGLLDDIPPISPAQRLGDLVVRQPARGVRDVVRGRGAKLAVNMVGQRGLEDLKYRLRRPRESIAHSRHSDAAPRP